MPVQRTNSEIKREIAERIESGEFSMGVPVLETD